MSTVVMVLLTIPHCSCSVSPWLWPSVRSGVTSSAPTSERPWCSSTGLRPPPLLDLPHRFHPPLPGYFVAYPYSVLYFVPYNI